VIVLDTNVLSESMRLRPEPQVLAWLDANPSDELWLTSITVAEILLGIARLPQGKRKLGLLEVASRMFSEDFEGRILAFDAQAAAEYAALVSARSRQGKPINMADAQIAALCRVHGATLATRNTRDFGGLGLSLVDPWRMQA
jgi:predicted nucleic acid-binding protein